MNINYTYVQYWAVISNFHKAFPPERRSSPAGMGHLFAAASAYDPLTNTMILNYIKTMGK